MQQQIKVIFVCPVQSHIGEQKHLHHTVVIVGTLLFQTTI